jgi:hypothetical protein
MGRFDLKRAFSGGNALVNSPFIDRVPYKTRTQRRQTISLQESTIIFDANVFPAKDEQIVVSFQQ